MLYTKVSVKDENAGNWLQLCGVECVCVCVCVCVCACVCVCVYLTGSTSLKVEKTCHSGCRKESLEWALDAVKLPFLEA